jgi:hypothetical protein
VRLLHPDAELAPTAEQRASLDRLEARFGAGQLLPLADWRARTPSPLWRAGRVDPLLPDEALCPVAGDPTDPAVLALLARSSRPELRPTVRWNGVLVLPSSEYFDGLYRSVQFESSDPVSFALLASEERAVFPEFGGWSASHCARRAVDDHAFWLQRFPATDPSETGTSLGLLLGAARAALFEQSLERGEPELAVTVGAAASRLAAEHPASAGLLDETLGGYRAWRAGGERPDPASVIALRRLIEDLPAYESRVPDPVQRMASMPTEAAAR